MEDSDSIKLHVLSLSLSLLWDVAPEWESDCIGIGLIHVALYHICAKWSSSKPQFKINCKKHFKVFLMCLFTSKVKTCILCQDTLSLPDGKLHGIIPKETLCWSCRTCFNPKMTTKQQFWISNMISFRDPPIWSKPKKSQVFLRWLSSVATVTSGRALPSASRPAHEKLGRT